MLTIRIYLLQNILRLAFITICLLQAFLTPTSALTQDELNTISVYEAVAPSVVNISTTALECDFFSCPVPTGGSGSGVIVSEEGLIVTAHHVISGSQSLDVALSDGSRWKAEVVGTAPEDDLAVIRIKAKDQSLKPITLGNSDNIEVGQKVLALGNPFGIGQTLTAGTISMKGRDIRDGGRAFRGMIQTDAAINPGNSGGALINSKGELIGINTAILSPTGAFSGVGFAVPSNRVKRVMPWMIYRWARWLGWAMALLLLAWILRKIYRPTMGRTGGVGG